jgi:nucleotide-binding universal stress UspA family protein
MDRQYLIATDLTEASEPAVQAGLALARRLGAAATLLHVTAPARPPRPPYVPLDEREEAFYREIAERERAAARRILDERVEPYRAEGASIETLVLAGDPVEVILSILNSGRVELLVTGTHGRTGLAHALIGSVAERCMREAPCPVLTVRATHEHRRTA